MSPENKAKWLTALRSGKYKQQVGALWNDGKNKFCCLGVACDIGITEPFDGVGDPLTSLVCEKDFVSWGNQRFLVGLNDKDRSFSEIADYIEKNL